MTWVGRPLKLARATSVARNMTATRMFAPALLAAASIAAVGCGSSAGPARSQVESHTGDSGVARVFVFGQLARLGDVSSFEPRRGWRRVVEGRAATAQVDLVVVPGDLPRNSLRSGADVAAAQAEGRVYVIETHRTIPRRQAYRFRLACVTTPHARVC